MSSYCMFAKKIKMTCPDQVTWSPGGVMSSYCMFAWIGSRVLFFFVCVCVIKFY